MPPPELWCMSEGKCPKHDISACFASGACPADLDTVRLRLSVMDEASGSVVESSVAEFAVDDGSQMRGVELAVKQLRPTERARLLIAASAPGATRRPAAKFRSRTLTLRRDVCAGRPDYGQASADGALRVELELLSCEPRKAVGEMDAAERLQEVERIRSLGVACFKNDDIVRRHPVPLSNGC